MQILCQLVSNIEVLDKTKLKSNVIMQMSRSERERDGSAADLPVARWSAADRRTLWRRGRPRSGRLEPPTGRRIDADVHGDQPHPRATRSTDGRFDAAPQGEPLPHLLWYKVSRPLNFIVDLSSIELGGAGRARDQRRKTQRPLGSAGAQHPAGRFRHLHLSGHQSVRIHQRVLHHPSRP